MDQKKKKVRLDDWNTTWLKFRSWATNRCHASFFINVSDRNGAQIKLFLHDKPFIWLFFINNSQDRRNMLGRIGGPSHSDWTMQFNWERTTILFSCVEEQTEENANTQFVMHIWEVPSGQNVRRAVLSVRGCLLWVISYWGHFMRIHV